MWDVALLRSTRCSSLSYKGRPRRADFAPRLRDALARGFRDVALLRSVSVNLAELRRAGALVRSVLVNLAELRRVAP